MDPGFWSWMGDTEDEPWQDEDFEYDYRQENDDDGWDDRDFDW